ncbi:phospho-N-acetylmuramoyl-pentapeptide-transferase [Mycoplasmatota bacterium]|nr:phospho-N-acetylmuramoyl-pentapeptide-transferase [Mycoplasmatota bacterium]
MIVIFTFVFSLIVTIILLLQLIPKLEQLRFGQIVRIEGPKNHLKKGGTPTMGGIAFIVGSLIAVAVISLINEWEHEQYKVAILFFLPMIFYGVLGFVDDYLVAIRRNNIGIKPSMKFFLQIMLSVLYFYIYLSFDMDTVIRVSSYEFDLVWVYGILILLMFTSSSNAVNLTDGLDGLATGLMIIALLAFSTIAFETNYTLFIIIISVIGSLVAFLLFNKNPAKIFMGDTGSLALGAILAAIAIILKKELLLIVIGGVFVIETLSVILQVAYFKKTKGKRIFLMSPLHHHFELKGMKEHSVVEMFWVMGFLFAILGLYLNGAI